MQQFVMRFSAEIIGMSFRNVQPFSNCLPGQAINIVHPQLAATARGYPRCRSAIIICVTVGDSHFRKFPIEKIFYFFDFSRARTNF